MMTFFTTKRKEFDRCINHLYTIYDDIDSLEKNLNELTIEISNNYNNDIKKHWPTVSFAFLVQKMIYRN